MTEHGCMLEEEVRGTAECEGEDETPFLELEKTIIKEFDLDVGRKPWIFYKEDGKDRMKSSSRVVKITSGCEVNYG